MYYLIILLVYFGVDAMACLALNQQFGMAGVTNFGFIIFQAAGAYAAAVLALPPDTANGGFQTYIAGLNWQFILPWVGAAVAGGLLALPFTFLVGRRLRGDFAAIGLLVTAVLLNLLATNYKPLFNGDAGVSLVPAPSLPGTAQQGLFVGTSGTYQWIFAGCVIVLAALVYLLLQRITESPYGRSLRAMRDNDKVADSLGKNLLAMRTAMLVLGGAIAGLSGGVLVSFIGVWAPSAWSYAETIVLFAAVIIGGAGNHRGALLGALLVPVGFEEITRFISNANPNLPPNLLPSVQWVAIGLLITVFLWLRPQGVLPERRRRIPLPAARPAAGTVRAGNAVLSVVEATAAVRRSPAERQAHDAGEVLRVAGVSKDFGGVHAVRDVSLSVRRGALTGLIGPNGAGKSTLLALLAGTERVTSGTIMYQGRDVTSLPAYRRARLGLTRTFQLASEFKRLTVTENLLTAVAGQRGDSFAGSLAGRRFWGRDEAAAAGRAAAMIRAFGLERQADDYAGDLSGGQRRLVEIMRALMTGADVLLLDEPMAGIHPELARQLGDTLTGLCRDGIAILMVEHELAIMDEFCDPVIVMAEGTVLAEGSMAQLRGRAEVVEAYLVG